MAKLDVGDRAPSFEAAAGDGSTVRLADLRGRHVVLYFYPKAFTPGCTAQTQAFRDHAAEIRQLGAEVIGVSVDEAPTLCAFGERYEVQFPLVADVGGAIARAYGVRRGLLGIAKRVTFVIDPEGLVVGRFHHELRATQHVDDVLELLRSRAGG
jgi:peroxiredoxin